MQEAEAGQHPAGNLCPNLHQLRFAFSIAFFYQETEGMQTVCNIKMDPQGWNTVYMMLSFWITRSSVSAVV